MDYDTFMPVLAGVLRHLLTTAGGALVAGGYMQSSDTPAFVGGGMVLAGIVWSWWQKRGQQEMLDLVRRAKGSPAAKAVIAFLVIGFALSFGFPALAATTTKKLTTAQAQANPLAVLQQLSVTDLQAALADAQANNDATTIPCWTALLAGVQAQQASAPALPSGVFSAIQKARDLKIQAANLLAPNGPLANLNVACAPLLMDANSTLAAFGIATGVVVGTGGIAIPALPGLLPLLLAPK